MPHDPHTGVHALVQARLRARSVGRDEDEVVLHAVVGVLRDRVVEQDRTGLGRHEFVRLLEDLPEEAVDLDLAGVGVVRLVSLEEVLEPPVVERVDLQQGAPGNVNFTI